MYTGNKHKEITVTVPASVNIFQSNERNDIWNESYIELWIWNQVKLWPLQLWTQF